MKSRLLKLISAFFLLAFFALAGCNKLPAPAQSTVTNFRDLVVSPSFNWQTTKNVTINVTVPSWAPNKILKIYSYDNSELYYAGFPNSSGQVTADITIPSASNMLKLVYGSGDKFKSVLAGVDGQLSFNYNSFKDSKASPCDLSGEMSYSQGGWSSDAHGNNPGTILNAHFNDAFPNGLVVGDPNHYTIKLTSPDAVRNFLPGGGGSVVLTKDYTDPAREHGKKADEIGGNWAGQIVAAEINVAFAQAGYIGTNSIKLGDLVWTGTGTSFDGMSVNDFLTIANTALGGGGLNGYSISDIQDLAELINTNFDEGANKGYLTCPSTATCGCKDALNSLSVKYTGNSSAQIIVKGEDSGHVYYQGTVDSNGSITINGTGENGKLDSNVDFYVNGNKNTTVHTTCSVVIYKGDVYGDFTITDGTSSGGLHLCENPTSGTCGCDTQLYSLTLRYDGSGTTEVTVKGKSHDAQVYCGKLNSGDEFSFNGSACDGALDKTLYIYENDSKNATINTSCDQDPTVGQKYGDFTIVSGTSKGNIALCDTTSNPGGGGGTTPPPPPSGGGTTTSNYNGSLAFEDLWPYMGDYDFNDVVVDYDFATTMDDQNNVQSITATFILHAFGASYHNGFGFQLPNVSPNQIISVTGSDLASNTYIHLASNGLEAGQSKATVIVFDDAYRLMHYVGPGIGVNTEMASPFITPDTIVVHMTFYSNGSFAPGGAVTYNKMDIGNFNPFIIVNQNRGVEVHLPNNPPTDLADKTLLGTGDDASDPATGSYYKTAKNLPWAINIPQTFQYPIEKQDILGAYLHFSDWAESNGTLYPDWYLDSPGYRDASLIYQPH
ncbi:MAG: LruC domain-containing protein [Bacteroidales bacterium]|nr:LruC domain-containing protein [Bacteroidales bacterium]